MPVRFGRVEKRISQAIPVELSTLGHPLETERVSTENVSSLGMRVVTKHPVEQNSRFMIRPLVRDKGAVAQVVYCQKLGEGRYGIGMRFLGLAMKWSTD
jgi:PilZ domain-containing protein